MRLQTLKELEPCTFLAGGHPPCWQWLSINRGVLCIQSRQCPVQWEFRSSHSSVTAPIPSRLFPASQSSQSPTSCAQGNCHWDFCPCRRTLLILEFCVRHVMYTLGFYLLTSSMWEVLVFDPRVPLHEHTTVCGFQLVAIFICFVSVVLFWRWWWSRCFTVVSKHFIANTWERSCWVLG